ncbi:MAG: ATP-dependent endonuclease [Planctomycetia bacterium]|nr:ATP-dependent endonuclease [Planctomycetia bacterium]
MSIFHDSSHGSPLAPQSDSARRHGVRLIVVVEGGFDIQFLKRISRILHDHDPQVPDLRALEDSGEILFLPIAGSNFLYWTHRLAGLGVPEFFILDREVSPLTEERERAAELVNQRPGCRAVMTSKRAMENYLDSQSLKEVRGIDVPFGDQDDVPRLAASALLQQAGGPDWSRLDSRSRRRLRNLAKRWLNTDAAERMTVERLAARDPVGEVWSWLMMIGEMGTVN